MFALILLTLNAYASEGKEVLRCQSSTKADDGYVFQVNKNTHYEHTTPDGPVRIVTTYDAKVSEDSFSGAKVKFTVENLKIYSNREDQYSDCSLVLFDRKDPKNLMIEANEGYADLAKSQERDTGNILLVKGGARDSLNCHISREFLKEFCPQ